MSQYAKANPDGPELQEVLADAVDETRKEIHMVLRIYDELEQGSDEWLAARCGLVTASVVGKLVTPTLKVADNDTSRGLTLTLAAERITGDVEYVHPSFDMQRGTDDEPFARAVYAQHFAPVAEIGFMARNFGGFTIGYSPDGLVGDDGLIEIKSRKPKEHLKTILAGQPPTENLAQLHTGLLVTGRDWIDYVSYSPGLPLWVKRVYPDTRFFDAIKAATETFETNVAAVIANYTEATHGLPITERRVELDEMEI